MPTEQEKDFGHLKETTDIKLEAIYRELKSEIYSIRDLISAAEARSDARDTRLRGDLERSFTTIERDMHWLKLILGAIVAPLLITVLGALLFK